MRPEPVSSSPGASVEMSDCIFMEASVREGPVFHVFGVAFRCAISAAAEATLSSPPPR